MSLFNQQHTLLVLGLGETGTSVLRWLKSVSDVTVIAADTRDAPPHIESLKKDFPRVTFFCGAAAENACLKADVIIVSPGVPLSYPPLQKARERDADIIGDVEIFARLLRAQQSTAKVIGITGSNGKSTVTTMVGDILTHAGYRTAVVGNIGTPVLDVCHGTESYDAYVLELSSFQLETTESLYLDAATVLNLSEDHLDRYADMTEYAAAKARIFKHCRQRVINRQDKFSVAMADQAAVYFGLDEPQGIRDWGIQQDAQGEMVYQGGHAYFSTQSLPITGLHNVANAMAALALSDAVGVSPSIGCEALMAFKGLPHRVEWVATHNHVSFYDDSKGTNVGATVAALEGLTQPVVLIAGGEGKGQDFTPLRAALQKHARALVLIGRDAPIIEAAVKGCGVPMIHAQDMHDAVEKAFSLAQAHDVVLLSPACASFDMFNNYAHRAEVFIQAVKDAIGERV